MEDDQDRRKDTGWDGEEEEQSLVGKWPEEIRNWDFVESYLLKDDQGQTLLSLAIKIFGTRDENES